MPCLRAVQKAAVGVVVSTGRGFGEPEGKPALLRCCSRFCELASRGAMSTLRPGGLQRERPMGCRVTLSRSPTGVCWVACSIGTVSSKENMTPAVCGVAISAIGWPVRVVKFLRAACHGARRDSAGRSVSPFLVD